MALVRISSVRPLDEFHVEITLTSGEVVQRDLRPHLKPWYDPLIRIPGLRGIGRDVKSILPVRLGG